MLQHAGVMKPAARLAVNARLIADLKQTPADCTGNLNIILAIEMIPEGKAHYGGVVRCGIVIVPAAEALALSSWRHAVFQGRL